MVLIIQESTSPDVGNEYGLGVIFRNQEISDSDSNYHFQVIWREYLYTDFSFSPHIVRVLSVYK